MDLDALARTLQEGFRATVRKSDRGENAPLHDPDFWRNYARWWTENGKF